MKARPPPFLLLLIYVWGNAANGRLAKPTDCQANSMKRLILLFVILLGLAGCTTQPVPDDLPLEILATPAPQSDLPTIAQIVQEDSEFLFLVGMLRNAGLLDLFDAPGDYTFFAATNTAFSKLGIPPTEIDAASMDSILRHHTLAGVYATADLEATGEVTSQDGAAIPITRDGEQLLMDLVPIVAGNIRASNGMVHIVDGFILPPESGPTVSLWQLVRADDRLSRFRQLVQQTDQVYALRFQYIDAVLAPDDQAFSRLTDAQQELLADPEEREHLAAYLLLNQNGWPLETPILLADLAGLPSVGSRLNFSFGFRNYENIAVSGSGDNLTLDGAGIVEGDLIGANGVLHILDQVIFPRRIENTP